MVTHRAFFIAIFFIIFFDIFYKIVNNARIKYVNETNEREK